jgi:2-polyprenyl-3-methyl-5-hydroxy-6-metoxy-1,4-benzoquinol methylase
MKNKKIDKYYFENRKDILNLIPEDVKNVLDLGCGSGITWKDTDFNVTGIEIVFKVAKFARENISNVIVANVEHLPIHNGKFDCIVFGDILEHLVNPWYALAKSKEILVNNGYVVASIPNLQYYKIVRKILRDEFEYSDYGILDIDHLRFFTLNTIKDMFRKSGFKILRIGRKLKFKPQYKTLNFIFFNKLLNFFTYQYYILAKKI